MKLKALVVLGGCFVLTTLIICVSVYSHYNSYANGSHNKDAETISVYSGANSTGLVTGHVSAAAEVGSDSDRDARNFWPGMKASVTASASGSENDSASGHGYVSGVDAWGWSHRRTVDLEWKDKKFKTRTTHTITPP